MRVVTASLALWLVAASAAHAQLEVSGDTLDNCGQIDALRKTGDYTAARDKAQLCLDALEARISGEVGDSFPQEVAGWTRTSIEQSEALGFTNISATYGKQDRVATVSLTGGSSGSGLGGLLGGLARAGLAQTGKQVRVAGLPGAVQADGSITVTLEDGSMLTFSCPDFDTADTALAGLGDLVNEFPVAEIKRKLQ